MGMGRYHGDRAFEAFLRAGRTPCISVNEAKRTLLPAAAGRPDLKSFDYVVYAPGGAGLLIDVKCRRLPTPRLTLVRPDGTRQAHRAAGRPARLESWVTTEDVRSLGTWQSLFGDAFKAAFVFLYWCDAGDGLATQPPDGLFDRVFLDHGRWYAVRGVLLDDYQRHQQLRSARWQTVDLPAPLFERLGNGFTRAWLDRARPITESGSPALPLPAAVAGR
ncbi:MAG: HYExAFE family protein [Phycisphaerales bacterium]|nr:HYExAFE family protein [Phycisphaerales bacterium]